MTQAEWLAEPGFLRLVAFTEESLSVHFSTRKKRLLAVALCRAIGMVATHPELGPAADAIERYADGQTDSSELGKACRACRIVAVRAHEEGLRTLAENPPDAAELRNALVNHSGIVADQRWGKVLSNLAWAVAFAGNTPVPLDRVAGKIQEAADGFGEDAILGFRPRPEIDSDLCALVREVLGNPFTRVAFRPEWRTNTAIAVANQIYESREFGAMPILADALQDAGCENDEVLNHCRNPGRHVRGCWVLDGVLEKR